MIYLVSQKDFTLQNIDFNSPIDDLGPIKLINPTKIYLLIKANWCGHCTRYLPVYEQMSNQQSDALFLVLETTQNESLVKAWENLISPAFEIQGYPTVVKYDSTGNPVEIVPDRMKLD